MKLDVIDETGNPLSDPYILRLPGWTWKRYLEEAPESRFCEYEEGELVMHSPVDADHQRLVRFLSWLLQAWCGSRKFGEVLNGPTAVKVAPRIGREPDIFVIHRRNVTAARGKVLKVVPRLAVEVVSPGTMRLDYDVKAREYAAYGIPEYWTVDRERRVLRRHFLSRGAARGRRRYEATEHVAGVLSSRALPGCRIRVDWLWAEPLPPEMRCWRFVRGASHSPRKRNE